MQKLTFGMERFTAPPGFTLKRSARRGVPATAKKEGLRVWGWIQNRSSPPSALCHLAPSPLNRAALRRSPGCCNLLSAWPDYRLLHNVWRRAAGRARWQEEGRVGGMEEAPLCRYMSTITFLLIYPQLYLAICTVSCLLLRF